MIVRLLTTTSYLTDIRNNNNSNNSICQCSTVVDYRRKAPVEAVVEVPAEQGQDNLTVIRFR